MSSASCWMRWPTPYPCIRPTAPLPKLKTLATDSTDKQRFGVTFSVATMTVEHVEVDEIRKDQSACRVAQRFNRLIDRLFVVLCSQILCYSERVVDRRDLSDTNNIEILVSKRRKKILARRRHCIIVTILSPIESARLAQEWTRNDTPDFV